jgi:hypothetical protein
VQQVVVALAAQQGPDRREREAAREAVVARAAVGRAAGADVEHVVTAAALDDVGSLLDRVVRVPPDEMIAAGAALIVSVRRRVPVTHSGVARSGAASMVIGCAKPAGLSRKSAPAAASGQRALVGPSATHGASAVRPTAPLAVTTRSIAVSTTASIGVSPGSGV